MKFKEFLETELNEKSKSNLEKDAASHIPELSKHILKVIRLEKHDDTLTHTRKIRREWLQTIYRLNKRGDFKLNTSKIFTVSDIEFNEYLKFVDTYSEQKVRDNIETKELFYSILEDLKKMVTKKTFVTSQEFEEYMKQYYKTI